MASIATTVAVAAVLLLLVLLIFVVVARGLPRDRGYEVEVKLFFATIRRRVDAAGSGTSLSETNAAGSSDDDQRSG
jgi:hypothetical protein